MVEAKPEGTTLSGVADQAGGYQHQLPPHLANWGDPLRFDYEASGSEPLFSDRADPQQRSRRLFAFHRPETPHGWLLDGGTLRGRLGCLPPLVAEGLRDCQVEAIAGLEASLARGRPKSLIQMTMGAGKTFTAATEAWRPPHLAPRPRNRPHLPRSDHRRGPDANGDLIEFASWRTSFMSPICERRRWAQYTLFSMRRSLRVDSAGALCVDVYASSDGDPERIGKVPILGHELDLLAAVLRFLLADRSIEGEALRHAGA
ncbi:MAG TPA: DEAD/DEAH box helicase family protein [Caulobacteraceae bacterium]|nr:DEAD/DEAH box helicase family protein [Caulobacteraceae bacterium]